MLKLSPSQMTAFEQAELATFEADMVAHCRPLLPIVASGLSDQQLRQVVKSGVERAGHRGLRSIGAVRLFIELSILFGSHFDADVQHPWAGECLGSADTATQYHRAEELFATSDEVIEQLCGPEDEHIEAAYHRLAAFASAPPAIGGDRFMQAAAAQMAQLYPQKHAFVSERALRSLIAAGRADSKRYGLSEPAEVLLLLLLMFTFGQGCATDPLYPQIGAALGQGSANSERVLSRAVSRWLNEALLGDERQSA